MMASKQTTLIVTLMLATLAVSGCNRSLGSLAPRSAEPTRLPSAPVGAVDTGQLPPPGSEEQLASADPSLTNDPVSTDPAAAAAPVAPAAVQPQQTASAPAPSGEPVSRESVSGTWNVLSDNPECRMILAFTKWSGGYRAATKRCDAPELASVAAWDVKGEQVVLMDGGGNTIARLYKSAGERYDGTTNSGQAISFTR